MVFSSLTFIFIFLPLVLLTYYALPRKFSNYIIFISSIIFYGIGVTNHIHYLILLLISIFVNYQLARKIIRYYRSERKKVFLIWGILYNLAWLILFKYSIVSPILPIGISFYTFQSISYLVDTYRDDKWKRSSFLEIGVYIAMYPQLIAGPIVTFGEIRDQLSKRTVDLAKIDLGLREFTLGLASKVLIANRIGSLWFEVNKIGFDSISSELAWLAIIAYTLQIYFDFYGYSLMAIGLGHMLGFDLPKNFDYPYLSKSMTEFWRRWHMTLGNWFKSYVYIPLGGNRCSKIRQIVNLLLVWILTGIWHGASLNFLIWAMFLFLIIVLEKYVLHYILEKVPFLARCYMTILIPISWVFFAITEPEGIPKYLEKLADIIQLPETGVLAWDFFYYAEIYGLTIVIALLFCSRIPGKIYRKFRYRKWMALLLLLMFWASVYYLYLGMDNPFLYYRF